MTSSEHDILASARRDMARQQLRSLLVVFAAGLVAMLVVGLVFRESETLFITGGNLLVLGLMTWLRERDRLVAAAMLASLALLASAAWATWTTPWGLLDSTVVIFVGAAIFAALLLPRNQLLVLLGLCGLAVIAVGFRTPLGMAPARDIGRTEPIDVAVVLLAVLLTASWVRRQNAMLWDTLQRAVANERELAASHGELERRQTQVLASEQRWRSLVAAAPDWIVQLEADGTIVFANREAFFAGDPTGRHLAELVDRAQRGQLEEALGATMRDGVPCSVELDLTVASSTRRCAFHFGPLGSESGPDGAIVLVSDVTERHRLQEQLLQTQKLDSIGQLAGGIAHDFNNLLTVMGGHADLALMKLDDDDPAREDIETILRTSDHASALTRQILAFSRRQPLRPEAVDLAAAIQEMQRMLERLIGEDIELEEDHARDLPPIEADPGSVEQVVMNLVVNARDAVREKAAAGQRRIGIATALRRLDAAEARQLGELEPGSYVELSVSDTGVGMDAELQSRIFEPFFTTKGPGHGTGLGLATVYGIVTQSGGTVQLDSAAGRGSVFRILWPTSEAATATTAAPAPAVDRLEGGERLLLVEDDDAVRELAATALGDLGYRVTAARDGREALELTDGGDRFDLVVTDVVMPGLSGFELRDRLPAGLPVLFCSGHTDLSWLPDGSLPPPEIFLAKPYGPLDLARKVRRILDAGRSA